MAFKSIFSFIGTLCTSLLLQYYRSWGLIDIIEYIGDFLTDVVYLLTNTKFSEKIVINVILTMSNIKSGIFYIYLREDLINHPGMKTDLEKLYISTLKQIAELSYLYLNLDLLIVSNYQILNSSYDAISKFSEIQKNRVISEISNISVNIMKNIELLSKKVSTEQMQRIAHLFEYNVAITVYSTIYYLKQYADPGISYEKSNIELIVDNHPYLKRCIDNLMILSKLEFYPRLNVPNFSELIRGYCEANIISDLSKIEDIRYTQLFRKNIKDLDEFLDKHLLKNVLKILDHKDLPYSYQSNIKKLTEKLGELRNIDKLSLKSLNEYVDEVIPLTEDINRLNIKNCFEPRDIRHYEEFEELLHAMKDHEEVTFGGFKRISSALCRRLARYYFNNEEIEMINRVEEQYIEKVIRSELTFNPRMFSLVNPLHIHRFEENEAEACKYMLKILENRLN
ncbi:hypothetical protein MMJJ_04780 [Methanococcus maripaludis]|nr:hypothetical protein MMJJ_04780 [Methanococcus maripaludis]